MLSRFIASFVPALLVFTALAAAVPQSDDGSSCNAGKIAHCCDSTHEPQIATRQLGGLGDALNLGGVLGKVGLGCTPISNIAATCKSQPVCCDEPASDTPVNVQTGCVTL